MKPPWRTSWRRSPKVGAAASLTTFRDLPRVFPIGYHPIFALNGIGGRGRKRDAVDRIKRPDSFIPLPFFLLMACEDVQVVVCRPRILVPPRQYPR